MGGGSEEEGFALETEIGLFAMKRDAVFRSLDPFLNADIDVNIIQLTPLVLYNFALFDQLGGLSSEEYDPDNPPESLVIVSLGTDATDLVITNGFRVWQRSIPLGGSHFTKALTKELKLTFAKAEHLKRNATAAADPKAVFQAMRPVFSDLLTELQRSISYFSNLDRNAKIERVIALGNAMKLPGLRRYLSQSLGYEIEKVESFRNLVGPQVISAPAFQENLLSFGVCYGLALQGLEKAGVHTNLLPKEITRDRLIRRKKPWVLAAVAVLMLGCTISFAYSTTSLFAVEPQKWKPTLDYAQQVIQTSTDLTSSYKKAHDKFVATDDIGKSLLRNTEQRVTWLEMLKAVNVCLPPYPPEQDDPSLPIMDRHDLHITSLNAQHIPNVEAWFAKVKPLYHEWSAEAPAGGIASQPTVGATSVPAAAGAGPPGPAPKGAGAPGPAAPGGGPPGAAAGPSRPAAGPGAGPGSGGPTPAAAGSGNQTGAAGPTGPGWIVELSGYHYHNNDPEHLGAQYVRETLIRKLASGTVTLPNDAGGEEEVPLKELAISYPVLITQVTSLQYYDLTDQVAQAAPLSAARRRQWRKETLPRPPFTM